MSFERLVGLNVVDEAGYGAYRAAMTPILKRYGGDFRYDFAIAEVLQTESEHSINRVFVVRFPDESAHDGFFSDEGYKQVRKRYFETSVSGVTIILNARCP